ncbi:MAG: Phosphoribosyltransferase, Orotidine 5-phosphate decarboxylase [Candidatus Magasanikbacteria bacterium GW2011_GWC2_34_16]|uniref:Orotate phosphoribosyltransferase n=2 Tax=Candidatus Magasanikiibacteriota TaxID=1752731 RepID=A0A0G0JW77_9BACT|nr:MAG: Phosphoribosyltransferase, Orotidine 5-phosphate decarboxylase [Candidatus Magasanikbacteria bacterium GW2011_GWC2_34_16]KKQ41094.1 MAG: Phosphoribosyltransferase, Orotidine 5-phosphate decarboxylase [Candidatus Magasanikbacteria bacterium GW2011_GWA2_37_8]
MTKDLILKLYEINAVKFGEFKLKSGIMSPIYIDLRITVSYPEVLKMVAEAMWQKVNDIKFDLICGVPYTALPIATVMSVEHNIPMIMRRKEVKDYGTKKAIEGKFETGQNCLIIEDLVTSGSSVFETIEPLQLEGLKVTDIVVLVDREQGGKKHLQTKGYNLHSVITISEMLEVLKTENKLEKEMVEKVKTFIQSNQV